jgi:hypothetical protein
MTEIQVTTRAVTDREVEAVFDAAFPDEWPVDAVRIAATVRAWRTELQVRDAEQESHTDWLNNLMDYASESFDGDEAMEALATRYVRALELVAEEALRVVLKMGHGDTALWDALHAVFPEKVPAGD